MSLCFNQDLSTWNVSRVAKMLGMFKGARMFNGNISSWDVSKVEKMWMIIRESLYLYCAAMVEVAVSCEFAK